MLSTIKNSSSFYLGFMKIEKGRIYTFNAEKKHLEILFLNSTIYLYFAYKLSISIFI